MLEREEVRTAIDEAETLRCVGRVTRVIGMLVEGDPPNDQTLEQIGQFREFLSQSRAESVPMGSSREARKKALEAPGSEVCCSDSRGEWSETGRPSRQANQERRR